jgi:hypothetical protein
VDAPAAVVETVARPLAASFERLAGRRGGEAVHRRGLVLGGRLRMRPGSRSTGAVLLDRDRDYPVQARLSWGLGPIGRLPDVAGLGLRVLDADGAGGRQDLLIDSCRPPPRDRVPTLRRDLAGWYGTPLRLRVARPTGPLVHVAGRIVVDGDRRRLGLDGARAAAVTGRLRVLVLVHDGRRRLATGTVVLDEVADPANPPRHRFDLANEAGGLLYAGFWQAVRRRTYAASRHGDPR